MTDIGTQGVISRPAKKLNDERPARISKPKPETGIALVSSYKLATHLGCSRQFIDALTAQGVIERLPGGFNQDRARLQYIAHLKVARRSTARSEADAQYTASKTRLMQLKIGLEEKRLMEVEECFWFLELLIGKFRTGLGSLPALVAGRDLQMRRRVEQCCFDILDGIAKDALAMAEKYEHELGIDPEHDYPTPP